MKKIFGLLLLSAALTGCTEKEYFNQVYVEDLKEYMEEDKDGFVLLVNDNDEYFQAYVQDVSESEEVEIDMYNVYRSKEGKEDDRPVLPYKDFNGLNKLYYISNNEVQSELDVTSYADMKLTEEIVHFVDVHN